MVIVYINARKFSTCLNEHWTVKGHHHLKAKIGYKTEEETKQFMIDNKINPKYKVYKCSHSSDKFDRGCYWWMKRHKLLIEYKKYLKNG